VLIVAETPSLGRSIADLLESGGISSRLVYDLYDVRAERPLRRVAERYPVVVAACNERFCATARHWARGELPNVAMVVVGDRDPGLASIAGVQVVPLPLLPSPFLLRVRQLLETGGVSSAVASATG